ncbi:MAG: mechanosensitive ion channel domain-containing protein [bacterium]
MPKILITGGAGFIGSHLCEKLYRVGENANIAGIRGDVIDFDLRKTVLRDNEETVHYISNRQIKISSNYSRK